MVPRPFHDQAQARIGQEGLGPQPGADVLGPMERADDPPVRVAQRGVDDLPVGPVQVGVAELLHDGEPLPPQGARHEAADYGGLLRQEKIREDLPHPHPVAVDPVELIAVGPIEGGDPEFQVEGADGGPAGLGDVLPKAGAHVGQVSIHQRLQVRPPAIASKAGGKYRLQPQPERREAI